MNFLILLFLSFFWSINASGVLTIENSLSHEVDMRNANYLLTQKIYESSSAGINESLVLYLSSRSVRSGLFGYARCSDFETSIEVMPEGRLRYRECGDGREVLFRDENYSAERENALIRRLLSHYREQQGGQVNAATLTELEHQLRNRPHVRKAWAEDAGVPTPEAKDGTVYRAENAPFDEIRVSGGRFQRRQNSGRIQIFDTEGRLVELRDHNGRGIRLTYRGGRLYQVINSQGNRLTFKYHSGGERVREITGPRRLKLEFDYDGEVLSRLQGPLGEFRYEYDESKNLTKVISPNGDNTVMTYNRERDWIRSLAYTEGGTRCREDYDYTIRSADNYVSKVTKTCGDQVVRSGEYEYWYANDSSGRNFLRRMRTKSGETVMDVTYHERFGRPIRSQRDDVVVRFEYYEEGPFAGLVEKRIEGNRAVHYEYRNTFRKVSKSTIVYLNQERKPIRQVETMFGYDERGNLNSIRHSGGFQASISTDSLGRVSRIQERRGGRELEITYIADTERPERIRQRGLGAITFHYDRQGQLQDARSDAGEAAERQIASTFQEIITLIEPAIPSLAL